jgi:hypothetical protein
MKLAAALLCALVATAAAEIYFKETFDGEEVCAVWAEPGAQGT